MRFIGDIHGHFDIYEALTKDVEQSIQVGDFGIGFDEGIVVPYLSMNHRFIRGNHDNPAECRKHPNYIEDGHTEIIDGARAMFVGGAKSIDRYKRIEGKEWWPDEEIQDYANWSHIFDIYENFRPDVMVTHDLPQSVAEEVFGFPIYDESETRLSFDFCVKHSFHKPKMWVFGHWHSMRDVIVDGVRYVCVDKNTYVDINLK